MRLGRSDSTRAAIPLRCGAAQDVAGSVGVKRMQREILDHFEDVLYPDGDGPLRQVLFEEYVVQ